MYRALDNISNTFKKRKIKKNSERRYIFLGRACLGWVGSSTAKHVFEVRLSAKATHRFSIKKIQNIDFFPGSKLLVNDTFCN